MKIVELAVKYIMNHWLINPSIMIDSVLNQQNKS